MALTLLLASLTTALVVNTWHNGSLFVPLLKALNTYVHRGQANVVLATIARGALCRYCVSHWVGLAVSCWMAPDWTTALMLTGPVIWLANYSISIYHAISSAHEAIVMYAESVRQKGRP